MAGGAGPAASFTLSHQGFSDFNSLIIPGVSDTIYSALQKYPFPSLVCL